MIDFLRKRQGGDMPDLGADGPSTSDEEEEDAAPPPRRTSRRGAVSADVMDADELDNGEPLKVIPKADDVMESLTKSVQENVLFQHLEPAELKSVLDAMFEVSPKATDIVIQQVGHDPPPPSPLPAACIYRMLKLLFALSLSRLYTRSLISGIVQDGYNLAHYN
jgi:hypothetical protein